MKTPESVLRDSVKQYEIMLACTQTVIEALNSNDFKKINRLASRMDAALRAIKQNSEDTEICIQQSPELTDSAPYKKRLSIARETARLTKILLPKLRGITTVQHDEFRKVAEGKVLINGYHSQTGRKGKFVNTTL